MRKQTGISNECNAVINPVGDALYVIGSKWKLLVIGALKDNGIRFNEIKRAIHGISARALSAELKELEINGFVTRTVNEDLTPATVEYQLTPYASTLDDILHALADWGVNHRKKIIAEWHQ